MCNRPKVGRPTGLRSRIPDRPPAQRLASSSTRLGDRVEGAWLGFEVTETFIERDESRVQGRGSG